MLVLGKQVQGGMHELTGGWLEWFSELKSEAFPCQSHGSV